MHVLGYIRVSTDEQDTGLDAQRATITAEAEHRGWRVTFIEDRASGKDAKRPGFTSALDSLAAGAAEGLVVAKLDRLSRSLLDFVTLMDSAQRQGWALIALDCAVDTSTPAGEMLVNVLATFAQFERRMISMRTREALAVKKAEGIVLGRPRTLPDAVRQFIHRERERGQTYQDIADGLNDAREPTAQGGARWYPATVRKIALSA